MFIVCFLSLEWLHLVIFLYSMLEAQFSLIAVYELIKFFWLCSVLIFQNLKKPAKNYSIK